MYGRPCEAHAVRLYGHSPLRLLYGRMAIRPYDFPRSLRTVPLSPTKESLPKESLPNNK
ncbi:hypothetical protein [Planktothricoides raciborskii]|uniref:hypothetical protein n=1 Tax=Planktothricoides raciborskii TaxID=132608 RepID=UPI001687C80F|nr:hypothetical protein [Planktothricoides raciborskii]